ncbi:MAG: hypothetical protein HEQ35_27040 [Gloeotrichia echinulata IR180]
MRDWGLGTGDWGLGTGDWGNDFPNAQCPMPNPLASYRYSTAQKQKC